MPGKGRGSNKKGDSRKRKVSRKVEDVESKVSDKKRQKKKELTKSKMPDTVRKMLECPICFNMMTGHIHRVNP